MDTGGIELNNARNWLYGTNSYLLRRVKSTVRLEEECGLEKFIMMKIEKVRVLPGRPLRHWSEESISINEKDVVQ